MIPDRKLIEKELAERGLYPYISVYETVDSTITRARSLISEHDGDILIVASSQTQGKGSHGRSFYSPQDTGLYFTAVYRDVSLIFPVTFAAGIASVRALHSFGIETSVKWVNDIYYDRMKAGGILCERTGSGEVIVGIGINLQEPEGGFPEEISGIAKAIGKDTLSRDLLAAALYSELTEEIRSDPAGVIERYRAVCDTVGRKISFVYDNKEMRGTALSVEDDGALSVMTEEGAILRFETGNVSIRYMDQQR
ncbi:MAG: biotin--[Oscillospiraceae bacterium]|nr:biotin--[acetyl-CoA-carboxylase] ligase [Oscillospiraceae bacterium]